MLNYSHAREHVFLTNIQDCEHSRVINSLTVPIPYKQLFNLALSDIKQSRFFSSASLFGVKLASEQEGSTNARISLVRVDFPVPLAEEITIA